MKKLLAFIALFFLASPVAAQYNSYGNFFDLRVSNQLLLPDGSASAPAWTFTSDTDAGAFLVSAGNIGISVGGTNRLLLSTSSMILYSSSYFGWSGGTPGVVAADVRLVREAANTLALRNSTNAQRFNIYNTYTDADNYEMGSVYWNANEFAVTTSAAGTGTSRSFRFLPGNGVTYFTSHLYPGANDTYNLGRAASALFWQNLYLSRSIQGSKTKSLADETAVDIVLIAIPDGEHVAGKAKYSAHDATSDDAVFYEISFACVNNADTETCTVSEDVETAVVTDGDTIDCTAAIDVDETNAVMFKTTCNQEGEDTTMTGYFRFDNVVAQTMTWQ